MIETGRRHQIDPEDARRVLEEATEPFLSTGEVADRIDASKPTVRDRLQTLEERGEIRSRMIGANAPAWYLPELENRWGERHSKHGPPDPPYVNKLMETDLATVVTEEQEYSTVTVKVYENWVKVIEEGDWIPRESVKRISAPP